MRRTWEKEQIKKAWQCTKNPSFYGHACLPQTGREQAAKDARGRNSPLSSFRRRPESSGFNHPFPHSGNDIRGGHWVSLARAVRKWQSLSPSACPPRRPVPDAALPPASMQAYIPVGVDSSFRWNDNEAIDANRQSYSLNPCLSVIPAKAGIQWFKQDIPA